MTPIFQQNGNVVQNMNTVVALHDHQHEHVNAREDEIPKRRGSTIMGVRFRSPMVYSGDCAVTTLSTSRYIIMGMPAPIHPADHGRYSPGRACSDAEGGRIKRCAGWASGFAT